MKTTITNLAGSLFLIIFLIFSSTAFAENNNVNVTPGANAVRYLSLNAVAQEKSVVVSWMTEEGANDSHYIVERSFNGQNFTTIGIVLDGFDSDNGKSYLFKESKTALEGNAVIYYRLKHTQPDGKFTYSNIINVTLKTDTEKFMQVSPNPFTVKINVLFNSNEKGYAEIRMVNVTGEVVLTRTVYVINGINNLNIESLGSLPSGVYAATVIMNDKVLNTKKIIK
ncbi:MAG: T9SS type A sorting domain-containing protein [Ferruginibacter sp.]